MTAGFEKFKAEIPSAEAEGRVERKKYETMLIGTLPFADQELYFSSLSQRSAMLLAGAPGCGKRTLARSFIAQYGGMFDAFLWFPFEEYAAKGEQELTDGLTEFFSGFSTAKEEKVENSSDEQDAEETEISSGKEDDDEQGSAYMIFLGDITAAGRMTTAEKALVKGIEELLKNEELMCIITAVYDADVRSVPRSLRRVMRICRVDAPSREERLKFFESAMEPLLGYVNDTAGIDFMADNTEGVSFSELEEIEKSLQMYLKAKFIVDVAETGGTEISEVEMSDIGIDRVELAQEDFLFIADSYKTEKPAAASVDMTEITQLLSQLAASGPKEDDSQKEPSPFALIDDDDDPDFRVI